MNDIYIFFTNIFEPFSSPFYLFSILLFLTICFKRINKIFYKIIILILFTIGFYILYNFLKLNEEVKLWLYRINSPFIASGIFLVIPALFLPRNKLYKYFLIIPGLCILFSIFEIIHQYSMIANSKFSWFLIRPGFLIPSIISILIIIQYFTKLDIFRKVVKISVLIVLVYGGFVFRQNYYDYNEMLNRRVDKSKDIMTLSETTPVMKYDDRIIYLPGAPCRFSADGGYVQGCVMELFQRIMQINFIKAVSSDPGETALLAIVIGAFLTLVILNFIGARWWCGWICPLSSIGDLVDFIRKKIGLPHLKPDRPVKLTYLFSGMGLGVFSLILAKAYTRIDENGKFLGCKIPVYPFCKICPAQQICPIAAKGPAGYPPIPGNEWLFGFFRYGSLLLLGVFIASFFAARRLYCRFCPIGMLGGLFNKGGFVALNKESRKCNKCGVCHEVCPMDISYVKDEMIKENVSSYDCIYCLKCVDKCPQDKCLNFEFAGKKIIESKYIK